MASYLHYRPDTEPQDIEENKALYKEHHEPQQQVCTQGEDRDRVTPYTIR